MDKDLLQAILRSSGKYVESLKSEKDLDQVIERVPIFDSTMSTAVATSLTDLIAFKITPEAHHKYAARLQIIKILRDWIRPPIGLAAYSTFCQNSKVSELCIHTVKKYLTKNLNQIINDNTPPYHIVTLIKSLQNLSHSTPLYTDSLKNIINHVVDLEVVYNSFELVEIILNCENELKLEFPIVQKLYLIQCAELIEGPIINCFVENLQKIDSLQQENNVENIADYSKINDDFFCRTPAIDELILRSLESPKIFQAICGVLTALFVHFEYSSLILNYVQFILKSILDRRPSDQKYLINLYPVHLQSCIIMMQIDPHYHTKTTINKLLINLEKIFNDNKDEALTLMIHFPKWLEELSIYLNNKMSTSTSSILIYNL